MIQLGNAVGHAELAELVAIGAESIGLDDLRAGFDVGLMNVKNGFGVRDVELVHAALRAHGFIEQRAHGAVGDQDRLLQSFFEVFNAHGFLLLAGSPPDGESCPASEAIGGGQKVRNYTIRAGGNRNARVGARRHRLGGVPGGDVRL